MKDKDKLEKYQQIALHAMEEMEIDPEDMLIEQLACLKHAPNFVLMSYVVTCANELKARGIDKFTMEDILE